MSTVHPSAIIDPTAELGKDVTVGPYAIIGPKTVIGDNCQIKSHAIIESHARLGSGCQVWPGAVIGGFPQDMKFKGEDSFVEIGDNAIIRECATVHRATGEDQITRLGSGCMLMAYSHVGHNSTLGNEVILANAVQLGGHVDIGDFCFIGGSCVLHQFVRVGRYAILGGFSGSRQDIPPFAMAEGRPVAVHGLNIIGLRRRGLDRDQRQRLKKAFHLLWFMDLPRHEAMAQVEEQMGDDPLVQELLAFVRTTKRGLVGSRRELDESATFNERPVAVEGVPSGD